MSAILNVETKKVLTAPLVNDNPITLQVLGICSAIGNCVFECGD
jgi:Na+-transporting NADH:ubiquinone oxidoreductase subunit D